MNNKFFGYLLGAISAASYGTNPLFAITLYRGGMNADSVLFFRYMFAVPMIAVMLWARGRSLKMTMPSVNYADGHLKIDLGESGMAVLMSIAMAFSSFALFTSYNYMDAGVASTLLFIYPTLVAVMMAVLYHEKAGGATYLSILFVGIGIGLLSYNGESITLSFVGMMWVFLSALSYAIYIIGVKHSQLSRVPTLAITFCVLMVGFLMFAVRVMINGSLVVPHTVMEWLCCLALAFFPTALSFMCTTQAINIIGSTPTAILGALEPVTAVIIGVCLLGETLTVRSFIGLLVIITAVTLVIVSGKISVYLTHFRRLFPSLRKKHPTT